MLWAELLKKQGFLYVKEVWWIKVRTSTNIGAKNDFCYNFFGSYYAGKCNICLCF